MPSPRNALSFIALLFLVTVTVPFALASPVPERPSNYVVDLAGIIEQSAEAKLNGFLRELEQKTGAQVILLSVDSLEGNSLEDFSLSVAEKWKLGQKDRDDGLLIFFAMKERKYRFEVGYGLEGILPDSLVGSIGRQYIVPYFRQGDYASGAAAAVLAVAGVIAKDKGIAITGMPRLSRPAAGTGAGAEREPSLGSKIMLVLFFIIFIYMMIRHPRLLFMFLIMSSMGGGRGSSWGGGGGFGGGGGGGFGGGGASGGW